MQSVLLLPLSYLLWHYTTAWGDLLRLYFNFTWFVWNFFSVRLLLGTLFSPWHRLKEGVSKGTGGLAGSLIINTILRFIGFFARVFTIFSGLIATVLFSLCFLAFLALWLALPILVPFLIVNGLIILISF